MFAVREVQSGIRAEGGSGSSIVRSGGLFFIKERANTAHLAIDANLGNPHIVSFDTGIFGNSSKPRRIICANISMFHNRYVNNRCRNFAAFRKVKSGKFSVGFLSSSVIHFSGFDRIARSANKFRAATGTRTDIDSVIVRDIFPCVYASISRRIIFIMTSVGAVLSSRSQSQVRPTTVQSVAGDMVNTYPIWGIQDKSVQTKHTPTTIRPLGLGTGIKEARLLITPGVPTIRGGQRKVSAVNQSYLALSKLNGNNLVHLGCHSFAHNYSTTDCTFGKGVSL